MMRNRLEYKREKNSKAHKFVSLFMFSNFIKFYSLFEKKVNKRINGLFLNRIVNFGLKKKKKIVSHYIR